MEVTYENIYKGYTINTNKEKGYGCFIHILNNYHTCLENMKQSHSKVIQIRFDLTYPRDGGIIPQYEHIQIFNFYFKRSLLRKVIPSGHSLDPRLVWTRELHTSQVPHFHHLVLLNGNAVQHWYEIVKMAEWQWGLVLGIDPTGLVHYCDKTPDGKKQENGIMYRSDRSEAERLRQENLMYYQASYLAKIRGKEGNQKGAWRSGSTRIPHKKAC